jgi:6-pyruvoyltetrahydropterin/6-carboxytetrahydropterin synthase
MWVLRKTVPFEAAHWLPAHDGKCQRLHGHSWRLTVEVRGTALHATGPKQGMVLDYGDISALVRPLVEGFLDHWCLNDTTGLVNPTSEELARWGYERLSGRLPGLYAVEIEETCTSAARYCPEGPLRGERSLL